MSEADLMKVRGLMNDFRLGLLLVLRRHGIFAVETASIGSRRYKKGFVSPGSTSVLYELVIDGKTLTIFYACEVELAGVEIQVFDPNRIVRILMKELPTFASTKVIDITDLDLTAPETSLDRFRSFIVGDILMNPGLSAVVVACGVIVCIFNIPSGLMIAFVGVSHLLSIGVMRLLGAPDR